MPTARLRRTVTVLALALATMGMRVEDVPNPRASHSGWVTDAAEVLDPESEARIEQMCADFEKATTGELAVVTIDSLVGMDVDDYARRLFDHWGIGKAGKDNGILILFARDERKIRIQPGRGVEAILDEGQAGLLLDRYAIPAFQVRQIPRGLTKLTERTIAHLRRDEALVRTGAGTAESATRPGESPTGPAAPGKAAPAKPKPVRRIPSSSSGPSPYSRERVAEWAYWLVGSLLGAGVVGLGGLAAIVRGQKTRAGKRKWNRKNIVFLVLLWMGTLAGIFAGGVQWGGFLTLALAGGVTSGLATVGAIFVRKALERHAENFHRTCPTCSAAEQLLAEDVDDEKLTVPEVAEEKVGGMDYEIWRCACGFEEKIGVRLGGASGCHRCRARTLTRTSRVTRSATTTSTGERVVTETCHNPQCDYRSSRTYTIPRISTTSTSSGSRSSSSSSRSSSSRSSFGGGRSGGGGASRGW